MQLRGVIADTDDRIGAKLPGMFEHQAMSIFPRSFTKLRIESDVATEYGLQARADRADDAA